MVSSRLYSAMILALLLALNGLANGDLEPVVDSDNVHVLELRVSNTLKCQLPVNDVQALPIVWRRDGKKVTEFNTVADPTKFEVIDNNLVIRRTAETDVETYSCEVTPEVGETITKEIRTLGKPLLKIIAPAVFIEGQKMKMECTAHGKPTPDILWRINNETYDETTGRVRLIPNSIGQPNGILEIDPAELSDRGDYYCVATSEATALLNSTVELQAYARVKDKLAAVWPFVGFCAEVIILCSIIFVYERNRTKADLDESDTDGGADQKAVSNHGKDVVRQRK